MRASGGSADPKVVQACSRDRLAAMTNLLLTPGPTPIPPDVVAAEARPLPHHRTPEFKVVLARVLERPAARLPHRARRDPVQLERHRARSSRPSRTCSRRATASSSSSAGNFGERWVKMGEAYRADVEVLRSPWGSRPDPEAVAERVNGRDDLAAVFVVHSETSTGATADVQAIAELTRDRSRAASWSTPSRRSARRRSRPMPGASTSSSTGSQKALMTPPGLAFASVVGARPRACGDGHEPALLARLGARAAGAGQGPDAVHAGDLAGRSALDAALQMIEAEGLEARFERTAAAGPRRPRRHAALGLELYSPDRDDCSLVDRRAVAGRASTARRSARGLRDRHGVDVAGGQGELEGRILAHRLVRGDRGGRHRARARGARGRAARRRPRDRARRRRRSVLARPRRA